MSYGPCSACGDGDTALKYHSHDVRNPRITVEQGRFSAERLYTLNEIEGLAQRYTKDFQMSVSDELGDFLQLSRFLAWLKKREREVEG